MRIVSLCVPIAFLCMSVYLSASLSKSLHVLVSSVCLSVSPFSLSQHMWCSSRRPGFTSSIPDISNFFLDSKSVLTKNLRLWKPTIMVLNYLSVTTTPSPMSKSGPDVFLIFQCSGICPTPAQGDILVSD